MIILYDNIRLLLDFISFNGVLDGWPQMSRQIFPAKAESLTN